MAGVPRISVVVPAYNRLAFLPEAIESVLAQTIDCWELLVVDDGSEEDIRGVMSPYLADPRVSYHRQKNAGRCVARNQGASATKGELLCFLDDDDRYLPDGFESLLGAFDAQPELGMAVGGYDFIDEYGEVTGTRRPWEERGDLDLEGWLVYGYAIPASTMIRRSWFEGTRGFDPTCEAGEDRDLFVRLALLDCPMAWVRKSVCHYRKHSGNSDTRQQHASKMLALQRAFRNPAVPTEVRAREREAYAGVHAYIARRAAAAGDDELVRELLAEIAALRIDPAWGRDGTLIAPHGFPVQIQYIVADLVERAERSGDDPEAELERAATAWGVPVRDLRRARAHREVRAFFRSLDRGDLSEAASHRRLALQLDPRWRAHRTLLVFPLRQAVARRKGAGVSG
jgi:glycosyltransferase involved in cell wall biosynthesis